LGCHLILNNGRKLDAMKKLLLAAVALGGLTALTATDASAAPLAAGVHAPPAQQPGLTQVNYYWHHRHWHHRHWDHRRWRYWD
jgi:hypothetical protein